MKLSTTTFPKLLVLAIALAVAFAALGWIVVPRPWYIRAFYSLAGTGIGSAIGATVGLVLGGIGLALGGWAFGVAGWLACAFVGAGAGSIATNVFLLASNPSMVTFSMGRFALVAVTLVSAVACLFYLIERVKRVPPPPGSNGP